MSAPALPGCVSSCRLSYCRTFAMQQTGFVFPLTQMSLRRRTPRQSGAAEASFVASSCTAGWHAAWGPCTASTGAERDNRSSTCGCSRCRSNCSCRSGLLSAWSFADAVSMSSKALPPVSQSSPLCRSSGCRSDSQCCICRAGLPAAVPAGQHLPGAYDAAPCYSARAWASAAWLQEQRCPADWLTYSCKCSCTATWLSVYLVKAVSVLAARHCS